MCHHQYMQAIFILIRNPDIQMRLRGLSAGVPGFPAQQARYAPDVRVDREALAPQAEQQHAGRGLGADPLERQHLPVRVVGGRVVQVIEAVSPVFGVDLLQDAEDDLGFDVGQPPAADGVLEPVSATLDDGFPIIAASVGLIHAQFRARAVRAAGVLGEDGADQGVEDGGAVAAAGGLGWRDECGRALAWAVDVGEDFESQVAFRGCWVDEGWKGGLVGVLGVGFQLTGLEEVFFVGSRLPLRALILRRIRCFFW